jgi:hypothetical protein
MANGTKGLQPFHCNGTGWGRRPPRGSRIGSNVPIPDIPAAGFARDRRTELSSNIFDGREAAAAAGHQQHVAGLDSMAARSSRFEKVRRSVVIDRPPSEATRTSRSGVRERN